MSNFEDFSLEQSEELIAKLKSGAPSEFEQLRSALNLLAHVTELPPTSIPPVLPSGIAQPVPILPVRSTKPRKTIITSIIVMGLFASASLAAAAVTGIGPAIIVNAGHQAAKFVKGVVGGVSHVVTGGSTSNASETTSNQNSSQLTPVVNPSASPAPTNDNLNQDNSQGPNPSSDNQNSNSEESHPAIVPFSTIFPPLLSNTNSNEDNSQKPNPSSDNQNSNSEESHLTTPEAQKPQTAQKDHNQISSKPSEQPSPEPTAEISSKPSEQPSPEPTAEISADPSTPTPDSEN